MQPEVVYDIVRSIDSDGDGLISFQDFKMAFHVEGDEKDVLRNFKSDEGGRAKSVLIPQKRIKELSTVVNDDSLAALEPLPDDVAFAFKVKMKDVDHDVHKVWNSEGTGPSLVPLCAGVRS